MIEVRLRLHFGEGRGSAIEAIRHVPDESKLPAFWEALREMYRRHDGLSISVVGLGPPGICLVVPLEFATVT